MSSYQYSVSSDAKAGAPPVGSLPYARSFRELIVYQKSRRLARDVFEITRRFPREEAYSLTDQWRRGARSIGGQIAEAWAKRSYPKHFVSKLTDADAEQHESQHWSLTAYDCVYISRDEARRLGEAAKEIGRMLGDRMQNAESFCGDSSIPVLRDTSSGWFTVDGLDTPLDTDD